MKKFSHKQKQEVMSAMMQAHRAGIAKGVKISSGVPGGAAPRPPMPPSAMPPAPGGPMAGPPPGVAGPMKRGGRVFKRGGPIEGSAAEEKSESPAFEKKEGKKGETAERFKPKKFSGGGCAVHSAGGSVGGKGDGIASRGRSRGRQV